MLERSVACLWVRPSETTPQACAEDPRAQRVCSPRLGRADVNKRCEMTLVRSLRSLQGRHTFFSRRHRKPGPISGLGFQVAVVPHSLFSRGGPWLLLQCVWGGLAELEGGLYSLVPGTGSCPPGRTSGCLFIDGTFHGWSRCRWTVVCFKRGPDAPSTGGLCVTLASAAVSNSCQLRLLPRVMSSRGPYLGGLPATLQMICAVGLAPVCIQTDKHTLSR